MFVKEMSMNSASVFIPVIVGDIFNAAEAMKKESPYMGKVNL